MRPNSPIRYLSSFALFFTCLPPPSSSLPLARSLSLFLSSHALAPSLSRTNARPLSYSLCLPLRRCLPLLLPASPPTLAYGLYVIRSLELALSRATSGSLHLVSPSVPSYPTVSVGFSLFLGSLSVRRRMSPAFESIGRSPRARGVPLPLLASSPAPQKEPILPATFFFAVPSDLLYHIRHQHYTSALISSVGNFASSRSLSAPRPPSFAPSCPSFARLSVPSPPLPRQAKHCYHLFSAPPPAAYAIYHTRHSPRLSVSSEYECLISLYHT